MDAQDQLAIAQLGMALALVAFALGYMRRRTRVDRYRESLFTLRDELFDYMWKNDVPFDLPAYRLMRDFLNGAIRVANVVTPLTLMVAALFAGSRPEPERALSVAIAEIGDPDVRERFERTRGDFTGVFLVFLGPIGLVIQLAVKLDRFKRTARAHVDRWMNELVVFGSHDTVVRPLFENKRSRLLFRW